jgi:hypothetical protein
MEYAKLANAGVLTQPVYEPGKPIETVAREYGLEPQEVAKLASNENPFGPSPLAVAAMQPFVGTSAPVSRWGLPSITRCNRACAWSGDGVHLGGQWLK